jgi:hypothetical protein
MDHEPLPRLITGGSDGAGGIEAPSDFTSRRIDAQEHDG